MVRQLLDKELGPSGRVLYLHADICRKDLLVEIEAILPTRIEAGIPMTL